MNKKWLAPILAFAALTSIQAQTLFTYGDHAVDAADFLRAYRKNNATVEGKGPGAIRQYLDLYIASRLKIQEAHERGYDTMPQVRAEIANLRSQIINNYLADEASIQKLVDEAFERSQTDIHAGHIFVAATTADGTRGAGWQKINQAYEALQKGTDFATVARKYSEDPSVKDNGGDLGYITVFSLPYDFENVFYNTRPGTWSKPFTSSAGYHIFLNAGTRKAAGTVTIKQILLAFPPGVNDQEKARIGKRADSLYNVLKKGGDFTSLARQFSNDNLSANSGGLVPDDIAVGAYDPVFETAVFRLKPNELARPFATSFGYHIVQLVARHTVPVTRDKTYMQQLRAGVEKSDRMQVPKKAMVQKVLQHAGFTKRIKDDPALWAFTDSLIEDRPMNRPLTLSRGAILFTLGDQNTNVQEWVNYAQTWRYKQDGSGVKPYPDLMQEFIDYTATNYYRDHLEAYNDDFRYQMNEFRDGNLFFEIMQREIWDKAQTDEKALRTYYEQHKDRYKWDKSADAVIFFCNDTTIVSLLREQVRHHPNEWRTIAASLSEKVVADSSRYELAQIPNPGKVSLEPGILTEAGHNDSDNSSSFAYIFRVYNKPATRSFDEARGFVINDYQDELDRKWVARLKEKYPVHINDEVLATLSK